MESTGPGSQGRTSAAELAGMGLLPLVHDIPTKALAAEKDQDHERQIHSLPPMARRRSLYNRSGLSDNDHIPLVANKEFGGTYHSVTAPVARHTESWEALAWPGFGISFYPMVA